MHTLIVIGTQQDPHVSSVAEKIKPLGVNVIVIDYFKPALVDLEIDIHGEACLKIDDEIVQPPFLIWNRLKLIPNTPFYFEGDKDIADLRAMEWRALYNLISKIFQDSLVNGLNTNLNMQKPYQQMVASKLGLQCPPTIISNSKAALLNFLDHEPDSIMKSLSGQPVSSSNEKKDYPNVIVTMALDRNAVETAAKETFEVCPHFIQRHIRKEYELRVVVVNDKVHAFKIPSQIHEYYAIDWRRGNSTLDFTPIKIAPSVSKKLIAFNREMGLFSGSFDLIVDKSGDYWFLECNQDGQWGWLDRVVDGEIAQTFANEFKLKLGLSEARHLILTSA